MAHAPISEEDEELPGSDEGGAQEDSGLIAPSVVRADDQPALVRSDSRNQSDDDVSDEVFDRISSIAPSTRVE